MADWTDERVMQLEDFRRLIRECQSIDRANNITIRLGDIIALANKLNDFSVFLVEDCVVTRRASMMEVHDVNDE